MIMVNFSFGLMIFVTFSLEVSTAKPENECKLVHGQEETKEASAAYQKLKPLFGKRYSVTDNDKTYEYLIGICTNGNPVSPVNSEYVAVWQRKLPNGDTVKIGQYDQTDIKAGTNWVYLEYLGGDPYNTHCGKETRKAVILITCDPEATDDSEPLQLIEESKNRSMGCYYLFELGHPEVCEVKQNSALSIGSIILIVLFSVVAVYLIAGALYQRFILGAKGIEQIPNYEFWKDFGNLQADGCDFICRSQNGWKATPYKGVGDDQLDEPDDRDDNLLPM